VLILSGFLPLLAMSLARLPQNVQRGYALSFTRRVNAAFGEGGGMTFPTRTLEYLAAFKQDVTSGKGDALPALLSAALTHVCGGRDEGAERCRSGLLQALLSTLQSDVQHFGGVRFSSH
jgi:hypothetical protein